MYFGARVSIVNAVGTSTAPWIMIYTESMPFSAVKSGDVHNDTIGNRKNEIKVT